MYWSSPADVVNKLGLKPEGDSTESILQCIRRELTILHPDKNENKFANKRNEERWHDLMKAREFLEQYASKTALIPVAQLPAIIASLQKAISEPLAARSSRLIAESRANIRHHAFFPKLTSGVFAAICGFLVTASSSLKDHPVLGHFIINPTVQTGLLAGMFISALWFLLTWLREGRADRHLEWLLTRAGTLSVLSHVLQESSHIEEGEALMFTLSSVSDTISVRRPSRRTLPSEIHGTVRVDSAIAEKTAKLMLEGLIDEGIIRELPREGLEQRYVIALKLAREIQGAHKTYG